MSMSDTERWAQWCGLTCLGGSERRECPCQGPWECQMRLRPEFEHKKREAALKLLRVVLTDALKDVEE